MLIRTVENKDNNMIDTGYLRLNITNNLNVPINNATIIKSIN